MNTRNLGFGGDTSRLLEVEEQRLGVGVDSVGQRSEGVRGWIVEETPFLKEKGDILLATSLVIVSYTVHS